MSFIRLCCVKSVFCLSSQKVWYFQRLCDLVYYVTNKLNIVQYLRIFIMWCPSGEPSVETGSYEKYNMISTAFMNIWCQKLNLSDVLELFWLVGVQVKMNTPENLISNCSVVFRCFLFQGTQRILYVWYTNYCTKKNKCKWRPWTHYTNYSTIVSKKWITSKPLSKHLEY